MPFFQFFPWNPNFLSLGDHTSGVGQMYVGNASPVAGDIVWQSGAIADRPVTTYFFEAYLMNVCCGTQYSGLNSDPILTFRISLDGGAPIDLATLTLPASNAGNWFGLSSNFNSGMATSVALSLINANTDRAGNDFALDDISLGTRSVVNAVPEPTTWAMMLTGFAMTGFAIRRRRRSVHACA